ncbi:MAG: Hsp33 family molecular chaperone HslO [Oscillospiraceae bacterium]
MMECYGKISTDDIQDGGILCCAMDSTDIAYRSEQIHRTSAVVTAGLGRLLTAASMMGCMLKGEDNSVTLRIQADGPAGNLIAVSDSRGNVRGCVDNPVVELELNQFGKLDVSGAVGKNGMLYVVSLGLKGPMWARFHCYPGNCGGYHQLFCRQ